ncbi:MAG: CapA family protein [Acidobacteriota bacterium]|nr:CapA family protein [Acidobacteriota bacterium]
MKIIAVITFTLLLLGPVWAQESNPEIEIAAVGDILLGRGVRKMIENQGLEYPFEETAEVLSNADLTFGNLENPLTDRCRKSLKKFRFRGDSQYAEILGQAGFDFISLANNHSLDCGRIGIEKTIESLARHQILSVGAGYDPGPGVGTAVAATRAGKIGFAAFTSISPVAPGEPFEGVLKSDAETVTQTISELKTRVDVVIVSFHWGTEYALGVNQDQVRPAKLAVEAGADVVLGHHPHVLQRIEVIDRGPWKRKALVAYSLGNFVFDSPVRLNRHLAESLILKLRVNAEGLLGAKIVPVSIEGYRAVLAKGEVRARILERIVRTSGKFGTEIVEDRIVLERGRNE